MVEWLIPWERAIWAVHILGVAFGIGGATVTDIMFFRFLKNYTITKREAQIMGLLSGLVWTGIALLVLSGLGLYVLDPESFNQDPLFLAKMTVVAVVVVNGALLNFYIEPKMERISFIEEEAQEDDQVKPIRRTAFSMGAVSFISWYGAFLLAAIEVLPLRYFWLVTIYIALIVVGIAGSQLVERYFERKAPPEKKLLSEEGEKG